MKNITKLIILCGFLFLGLTVKSQQVNVTWTDQNYTGYYVVSIYVQINDGSSPFWVGEQRNVTGTSTFFYLTDLELPTVINDRKDYYKYFAVVYRQSDPTHYGQNNSGWLDSDEFLAGATIPTIIIN
ncbi:MAG TPA: hypothetical protein PK904_19495 [Bacteroidales bacterium]|jgi:hypothetical protein|nr:hypothetical protein [Bacteroidales bacterium]